jgi:hypothetical protein
MGLGIAAIAFVLAVVFLWPGEATGPAPIRHGFDACARCRMLIGSPGFGGELRDQHGILTKYDDVGCLLGAMLGSRGEMPDAWVEDRDSGTLVPLLTAQLVHTDGVETPMGHGIVAFRDEGVARAFVAAQGGALVRLEDVLRDPEQLARTGREPAR